MATETTTRADVARKKADSDLMRNAARNVRMCQMRALGTSNMAIAEAAGLSPSRTSRIISKGEDHWQMWLERAIEDGIEQEAFGGAVPDPDGERVEMIDITRIADNPYQPRKTVFEEDVANMLQDIAENGLHHAIVLRYKGASLELVLGQLRLKAFRMGAESEAAGAPVQGEAWTEYYDTTGVTRIPAIVREMTDEEVVIASLSENLNRNRMVWSDETRALDLAAQQPGMTARQVAAAAKMSPAQLSNRRRLLKLGDRTLSLVDKDILSWTAARELLAFAPDDHIHQEELDYCEQRLWAKHREYVNQGRPTERLTAQQVHTVMANALGVEPDQWACLSKSIHQGGFWIRGKNFKPEPKFDVDAFKGKQGDWVHTLPRLWGTTPEKTEVTCVGWIWAEWQERAEAEIRKSHGPWTRNDADTHFMCAGCGIPKTAPAIEQERCSRRLTANPEKERAFRRQVFSNENDNAQSEPTDDESSDELGQKAREFSDKNPDVARRLPEAVLNLLDQGFKETGFLGELANALVPFGNHSKDHRHHAVLGNIAARIRQLGPERVNRLQCQRVLLRALQAYSYQFRSLDDRLTAHGFTSPRFDVQEFTASCNPELRHCIKLSEGLVEVTCNTSGWDHWQAEADKATRQQVARGNEPAAPAEEKSAQLMDMSMVEGADEHQGNAPIFGESVLVDECPRGKGEGRPRQDHWHVMTKVGAPGFATKARRSPALWFWDDVMQYLEQLEDDVGDTPWVEEHVYDSTV